MSKTYQQINKEKLDVFQDWYYLNDTSKFDKCCEIMIEDGYVQPQLHLLKQDNQEKAEKYLQWLKIQAFMYMVDCLE